MGLSNLYCDTYKLINKEVHILPPKLDADAIHLCLHP